MSSVYDTFLTQTTPVSTKVSSVYSTFQQDQARKQKKGSVYQSYLDAKANPPVPFSQKIIQGVKDYANESARITEAFPSRVMHPIDTFKKLADTMKKDWEAGVMKAGTPVPNGNTVTDIANLISGTAQAFFSPVAGLFKAAENVPGAKQVADLINIPFTVTGLLGSYGSGKIVDALPISDETKDIIRQPIQDVGSLAGQIVLGGKIMSKIAALKGKELTPEVAKKIVVESQAEVRNVPLNTPKTRQAEYAKSQGYEPYTPPEKLPTIEMGPKAKPALPEIQTGEAKMSAPPGLKYEPVSSSPLYDQFKKETASAVKSPVSDVVPTPVNRSTEPIKAGVETKPTKLVSTLESETVASKIKADFGESPEYQTMNMADQAARALDLMKKSPEYAKNIIEGKAPPPEGLKLGSVYTAMKVEAIKKGDVGKILELSRSKANEIASSYGQEVKAFDAQLEKGIVDPVKAIQDIKNTRQTALESRPSVKLKLDADVKGMKQSLEAKKPTKMDWESFIKSIEC